MIRLQAEYCGKKSRCPVQGCLRGGLNSGDARNNLRISYYFVVGADSVGEVIHYR